MLLSERVAHSMLRHAHDKPKFFSTMKHFFLFIATALLGAAMVSCSSDDNVSELPQAVPVLKASTFFKVLGGENTVTTATAPAQAYALDKWLEVSHSGTTVTLKAAINEDSQSRNTLLVLKNAAGDSTTLNVMQEGINFGLPQDEAYYGGDDAHTATINVSSNIEVTYSSTANWLTLTREGNNLNVALTANATGRPRVGFIKAEGQGKVDSLIFVQASLADVAGEYTQTALQGRNLDEVTSNIVIRRVNNTKAQFIIDGTYTWDIDFQPGRGFTMSNGKVLREVVENGTRFYLESLIAVDSYNYSQGAQTQTVLIGSGDLLDLRIANDGSLYFAQHSKLDETRNWASYAIGRSTTRALDQGSWRGIVTEFIKPKLVRK